MEGPEKKRKGRRAVVIDENMRERVRAMVEDGASVEAIAADLKISKPSVRKHFAAELVPPTPLLEAQPPHPAPKRPRRKPAKTKPAYRPSTDDRRRVELWLAASTPRPSLSLIAEKLGISEPTVRKAFAHEIADADARARMMLIDRLHTASVGGSVAATNRLLDMVDKSRIAALATDLSHPQRRAAPEKPVGKKIAAHRAAFAVVDSPDWGPDLQPGMLKLPQ